MSQKNIEVLMAENRTFPPSKEFSEKAHIKSFADYEKMYQKSVQDPDGFWAEMAEKQLTWFKKWDKVLEYDFSKPEIKWFQGGKLNVSYNCLDRHINKATRNKAAIIWEADDGSYKTYTYQQMYYEVNRFANVLKKHGVKKGDRVTIYLPMIPELAISMLACSRIGAIHSIVFGGFSAQALRDRIQDCKAKLVVTSDRGMRGGRQVALKANADEAIQECPTVEKMIVVKRTDGIDMEPGRDLWWHDEMNAGDIANYCEPEHMDAEDPLFILYTSGSTGKPKGVLHTTGGYLLYTNLTFKWIFDYHEEDIHFCTADIGWVTGHSYIVYGPLSLGATSLMFEGIPTYPDAGRFWSIVAKHKVNIFYTAPTAIRALMREGEAHVQKHDLSSLRVLGTVGEPINPEAWMWYHINVGKEKLPIVDTWWQTETGGILITPLPGAMTLKPGSANRPFPGVVPRVLKEDGSPAGANEGGYLVIEKPWPGMIRGTYGDPENKRVKEVYFSRFANKYLTGDGARVDEDGDYWLMGRIDDVINISGHRLGTAEVESALVSHESVAEAAVVGFPHEIKGEGIYVYVTLKEGFKATDELKKILVGHVRTVIGPIATPDKLQFAPGLPKTRSGKIMRRILRKIAWGQVEELGDTSTLADPSVVDNLVKERL
ncbi:Acetyl-CoA synthetase (AMP-forming) [Candidatus Sulfobium mesophilum]|uniref:Acetyl-coenzyme A synthetase n=1 Tax=Candidatus Sulfobium mesophilum TaxID=2016548 RepID=A0A2U3QFQ3_9BACT|nr:Acetyl-CoA synthetase (AMP-forming) [Candidatus Sulfobium mesophilum]